MKGVFKKNVKESMRVIAWELDVHKHMKEENPNCTYFGWTHDNKEYYVFEGCIAFGSSIDGKYHGWELIDSYMDTLRQFYDNDRQAYDSLKEKEEESLLFVSDFVLNKMLPKPQRKMNLKEPPYVKPDTQAKKKHTFERRKAERKRSSALQFDRNTKVDA